MSRPAFPPIAVIALVGVAVFAAGACASWLWLVPETPGSLAAPTTAAAAPVTYRDYDDARSVSVDVVAGAKTPLVSGASGRVTASACSAGSVIGSGTRFLSVDGAPLVTLATATPLWRDLSDGDTGDDVQALQAELVRLGSPIAMDGRMGRDTLGAVADLLKRAGDFGKTEDSSPPTTVAAGRFVWLPAPSARIRTCDAAVGTTVTAGGIIATTEGGVDRAAVAHLPSGLSPGERDLTVDDVTVPVDAGGAITASEALAALATTPSFARGSAGSDSGGTGSDGETGASTITGRLTLRTPVKVGVVSPSAVYAITGSTGCVASEGVAHRVTIVGSQLGQTYVRFEKGDRPRSVDLSAIGRPSCS